jgi:hypothetical protein
MLHEGELSQSHQAQHCLLTNLKTQPISGNLLHNKLSILLSNASCLHALMHALFVSYAFVLGKMELQVPWRLDRPLHYQQSQSQKTHAGLMPLVYVHAVLLSCKLCANLPTQTHEPASWRGKKCSCCSFITTRRLACTLLHLCFQPFLHMHGFTKWQWSTCNPLNHVTQCSC